MLLMLTDKCPEQGLCAHALQACWIADRYSFPHTGAEGVSLRLAAEETSSSMPPRSGPKMRSSSASRARVKSITSSKEGDPYWSSSCSTG